MSIPNHWTELKNLAYRQTVVEADLTILINSPSGRGMLWVLVEGDADPYFYERMFVPTHTKVIKVGIDDLKGNIHGGYRAVIELVGKMLVLSPWVIGIVDRDWRPYKKSSEQTLPTNIFVTDERDLEMTLLSFPNVRKNLGREVIDNMNAKHMHWFNNGYWYKRTGDWFKDVWERCSMVSRYMGSLRIVAAHFGLPRVDFFVKDYWNERNHSLLTNWEISLFNTALRQCGCGRIRLLLYSWAVRYKFDINHRTLFDVCRGHDFLSVLSNMLIDSQHFSEPWMTFFMTKEISLEEIKSLRLYCNIDGWMKKWNKSFLN